MLNVRLDHLIRQRARRSTELASRGALVQDHQKEKVSNLLHCAPILLVFFFPVWLGAGCDSRKESAVTVPTEQSEERPNAWPSASRHSGISSQDVKERARTASGSPMWVEIWCQVAVQEGLPSDDIDQVANIISEVLDYAHPTDGERSSLLSIQQGYRQSLHNFIATQYPQLTPDAPRAEKVKGVAYWLAYCVAEAARRHSRSASRGAASYKAYEKAVKTICDTVIRPGFRRVLSAEDYESWSDEIERGIARFQVNMRKHIEQFQGDILCPAFREQEPLTAPALERIKKSFSHDKRIPKYDEPVEMMVSKDKLFIYQLNTFFDHRAVEYCLFDMFLLQIKPELKQNRYWGYMKWYAESQIVTKSYGVERPWPVRARLYPNERLNEIKNWRRQDE